MLIFPFTNVVALYCMYCKFNTIHPHQMNSRSTMCYMYFCYSFRLILWSNWKFICLIGVIILKKGVGLVSLWSDAAKLQPMVIYIWLRLGKITNHILQCLKTFEATSLYIIFFFAEDEFWSSNWIFSNMTIGSSWHELR